MDTGPEELAEAIKSGEYFEQSRAWYRTMYIALVPERTFFLVVAALASTIAFIAFLAVMAFLPLTDKPGIMVVNNRFDDSVPRLEMIKKVEGMPLNEAMERFYIESYVTRREGYDPLTYELNHKFIQAQSDDVTYNAYAAVYGRGNPASPVSILGATGKRLVQVNSIQINNNVEPKVATVNFTTQLNGAGDISPVNWTAVLQFYYSDLEVRQTEDPETGEKGFQTQDAQFRVVNYALNQAR